MSYDPKEIGAGKLIAAKNDGEGGLNFFAGQTDITEKMGGGGWPADLPKPGAGGYGYTEQGEQTVIVDNESVATVVDEEQISGDFATPFDIVDGAYTVIFNGTEYNLNSTVGGVEVGAYLGELDGFSPDFSQYPFLIISHPSLGSWLFTESAGTYTITIKKPSETVHKIDEKYLPKAGGTMMVNITADEDSGDFAADKTYDEIMAAIAAGVVVKCIVHDEETGPNYVCDLRSYDIRK